MFKFAESTKTKVYAIIYSTMLNSQLTQLTDALDFVKRTPWQTVRLPNYRTMWQYRPR